MSREIANSPLGCEPPSTASAAELFKTYDDTLRCLANNSHQSALSSVVYGSCLLGSTPSAVQSDVIVVVKNDCTGALVTPPAKLPT